MRRRSFEGHPESQERSKRKGKEDTIVGANAGGLEDASPTVDHAIPALRSIKPSYRPARSATRLMESHVSFHRVAEVGAVGRVLRLIFGEFRFTGKRHLRDEVRKRRYLSDTGVLQLGRIERVSLGYRRQQRLQLL